MGLRTPSVSNEALTNKQRDMLTARHPDSGNQLNQLTQEQKNINRQIDEKNKGVATAKQAQQQASAPVNRAVQPQQSMSNTQRGLSSLSNRYQAKVNEILSGGNVSQLSTQQAEPVFVPGVGWQMPDMSSPENIFDVSQLAQQKLGDISSLKEQMSPYFSYTDTGEKVAVEARGFDEVLKQFADQNNDGVISPEEQQLLNDSVEVAAMLERLDKINPNSAEAKALEMQLQILDETGLVSGIQRAFDQYRRVVGEGKGGTFYGPEGKQVDLEGLVNMSLDDVKNNLMYVLTGEQPSIFGGDFEQALKGTELATKFQQTQQLDTQTRNAIMDATANWGDTLANNFQNYNDEIQAGFAGAFEKANENFSRMLQGATTEEEKQQIEAAWQWFDDIFKGEGADNPAKVLEELLSSDSGMAVSQRMALAKWLGGAVGVDPTMFQGGIIKDILDSVAEKGYAEIDVRDENGNPEIVKFQLDDADRLKIARILYSGENDLVKQQKIEDIVDSKLRKRFDASGDLKAIEGYFQNNQFASGLDAFVESVVKSLSTYNNSLTKDMYDEITKGGDFSQLAGAPEGADPRDYIDAEKVQNIYALATEKAGQRAQKLSQSAEAIKKTLLNNKATAEQDLAHLNDLKLAIAEAGSQALTDIKSSLTSAIKTDRYPENSRAFDNAMKAVIGAGYNPNSEQATLAKQAYTMAATMNQIARFDPNSVLYKNFMAGVTPEIADWIKYPNKILSEFYSPGRGYGDTSQMYFNLLRSVNRGIQTSAPQLYNESEAGKAMANSYQNINRDITNANDFLGKFDELNATIDAITQASMDEVEKISTYSPDQVAKLALEEARRFETSEEAGRFTGGETRNVRSITMLPEAISKSDFEDRISEMVKGSMYGAATAEIPSQVFGYTPQEFSQIPGYQGIQTWADERAREGEVLTPPPGYGAEASGIMLDPRNSTPAPGQSGRPFGESSNMNVSGISQANPKDYSKNETVRK